MGVGSRTGPREPPKATGTRFEAVLGKTPPKKGVNWPQRAGRPAVAVGRSALVPEREPGKGRSREEPTASGSASARAPSTTARDDEAGATELEPKGHRAQRVATDADLLDPATRQLAHLAPPATGPPPAAAQVAHETVMRARSLEELLPALVQRIAWAGDRHRGTVRLELGAGAYAGTTVIVHADRGKVRVETFGEPSATERLRSRLDARLRGHGLDVESVT